MKNKAGKTFEDWYNNWIETGPDLGPKDLAEAAWIECFQWAHRKGYEVGHHDGHLEGHRKGKKDEYARIQELNDATWGRDKGRQKQ